MKACINFKEIIQLYTNKYFPFCINKNNYNNNINDFDKFELLEFTFLKLIENCINCMNLNDNDLAELYECLLSLIYYNYYNNELKLLIYGLECLTRVNNSYEFLIFISLVYKNKFLTFLRA